MIWIIDRRVEYSENYRYARCCWSLIGPSCHDNTHNHSTQHISTNLNRTDSVRGLSSCGVLKRIESTHQRLVHGIILLHSSWTRIGWYNKHSFLIRLCRSVVVDESFIYSIWIWMLFIHRWKEYRNEYMTGLFAFCFSHFVVRTANQGVRCALSVPRRVAYPFPHVCVVCVRAFLFCPQNYTRKKLCL